MNVSVVPHQLPRFIGAQFPALATHTQQDVQNANAVDLNAYVHQVESDLRELQPQDQTQYALAVGERFLPVPSDQASRFGLLTRPIINQLAEPIEGGALIDSMSVIAQKAVLQNGVLTIPREELSYNPKTQADGITTWEDLLSLITQLTNAQSDVPIRLDLFTHQFTNIFPTPDFLQSVQKLAQQKSATITLNFSGDPREPLAVYSFTSQGMQTSVQGFHSEKKWQILYNPLLAGVGFWKDQNIQNQFTDFLKKKKSSHKKLKLGKIYQAFADVGAQQLQITQAKYLERVFQTLAKQRPALRRTEILHFIKELREAFAEFVTALSEEQTESLSPLVRTQLFSANPIDTLLRHFQDDTLRHDGEARQRGLFSVGAGQMVAMSGFARHLMDLGLLPLTFRLAASGRDGSVATANQINNHGVNKQLPGQKLNTGEADIFSLAFDEARCQYLLTYQPNALLLNLKGKDIGGVMADVAFQEVLKKIQAILAVPIKSYQSGKNEKGEARSILPFLDIYRQLYSIDPELAKNFVVIAGFYEAPKILRYPRQANGEDYAAQESENLAHQVDMAFFSENLEAALGLVFFLSAASPNEKRRADSPWVNAKGLEGFALAVFSMAAGANKNFFTYDSAKNLLGDILNHSADELTPRQVTALNQKIADEWMTNVQDSDELTSLLLALEGIPASHLWSARAIVQDFRFCLPTSVDQMVLIKKAANAILTKPKASAVSVFKEIHQTLPRDLRTASQGRLAQISKTLSREEQQRAYLAELITLIQQGFGGGTRNCRDGLIDGLLEYFYAKLSRSHQSFEEFHAEFFPQNWQQEGRAGIVHLVKFLIENGVPLPPRLARIYKSYQRTDDDVTPSAANVLEKTYTARLSTEGMDQYTTHSNADQIHEIWGLETWFVKALKNKINAVTGIFSEDQSLTEHGALAVISYMQELLKKIESSSDNPQKYGHIYGSSVLVSQRLWEVSRLLEEIKKTLQESESLSNLNQFFELLREAFFNASGNLARTDEDVETQKHNLSKYLQTLCQQLNWAKLRLLNLCAEDGPNYAQEHNKHQLLQQNPKPRFTPREQTVQPAESQIDPYLYPADLDYDDFVALQAWALIRAGLHMVGSDATAP